MKRYHEHLGLLTDKYICFKHLLPNVAYSVRRALDNLAPQGIRKDADEILTM